MITGVDLGLKSTGFVTLSKDGKLISQGVVGSDAIKKLEPKRQKSDAGRFSLFYDYARDYFVSNRVVGTIVLEAPKGNLRGYAKNLLVLQGVLYIVFREFCPTDRIYVPTPTAIKKAFTGSGSASKDDMIGRCKDFKFITTNDHLADAYALAWTGINKPEILPLK